MTTPAGGQAAAVWVAVLPDLSNFGATLTRGVAGAGQNAGARMGSDMGEATESSFAKAAKGIAVAGTAIGAAIGVALVAAMNVEAANDKLSAQLGLSAKDAERYGKIAGGLYSANYGDSLETVNEALRQVTLNVGATATSSDADLQRITASVLDVATAFDQDLGGVTVAVGQLMKTGLAPNADAALDIVTVGFQRGADKAGDFLDTLNEYGGQFQKLGLDGAAATGLITQGLQAGARDADLVADAFKEFSIRAVDGSKLTGEGFKALGLDASDMAAKIAAGGPQAAGALDLVLDRLRAIPDPVQRSQAAVALFGTQAEDLGAALFALDPSTAVEGLGQVGGAAAEMGKTLNDNAGANLESFKRQVISAFVDVVGGQVLPAVTAVASFLATSFGPALSAVGGFLTGTVIPGFQAFGGWLRDSQGWLLPLAAGIGTLTLALSASTIATALWGAATSAAAAIMGVVRGAVLAFQVAVWLLNAAMTANPIGIVIAVLAGLVAAVIVAYNTSDTFRAIVQGAWQAIQTVVEWAWNNVIKPIFDAHVAFLTNVLIPVVMWLWNNVIKPAWDGIGVIIAFVWNNVIKPIFDAHVAFVTNVLGPVIMWLWNNVIKPAWDGIVAGITAAWSFLAPIFAGIGAAVEFMGRLIFAIIVGTIIVAWELLSTVITAVWTGVIKPVWDAVAAAAVRLWEIGLRPVFDLIAAGWAAMGRANELIYQSVIRPTWDGVAAAARFLWENILRPVFDLIAAGWAAMGQANNQIYQSVIRPTFEGVQATVTFMWENILRPVFDLIAAGWAAMGRANELIYRTVIAPVFGFFADAVTTFSGVFARVVDGIKTVWASIQDAFKAPIKFVVETVWNNGIGALWDKAAALFPLGAFPRVVLPFAKGGPIEHPTVALMGEAGPEYVLSAPAVAGLGGMDAVDRLHKQALREPVSLKALNSGNYVEGADHEGAGISSAGYGGVKPHVARAGHLLQQMFGIGSVGGVGQRANPSDHPRGLALDFMTYSDQGKGDRLASYMQANAGHLAVKYLIWRQRINSGSGWQGMEDRGSVTANHYDHVHASFLDGPGGGGAFSGDGGGFFNPLPEIIRGFFDVLVNPIVNAIPGGPPMILDIPKAIATMIRDKSLRFLLEKAGETFDSGGLAHGRGMLTKDTIDPERVLSPRQTAAFERLVDTLDSMPTPTGMDGGGQVGPKLDELIALLRSLPFGITVEDHSGNPVETAQATKFAFLMSR